MEDDNNSNRLFELADLILAVGRQIRSTQDRSIGMCTPVESAVMRFISRSPGTTARAASEATQLPPSNFSRVLRSLEEKGLVRREADQWDARCVRLYPTDRAHENLQHLSESWSRTLEGIVDDPHAIDFVNATLQQIESGLSTRYPGVSNGPRQGTSTGRDDGLRPAHAS